MIKGCILPWIHMHGNIKGNYKVCCFSEGALDPEYTLGNNSTSLLEVWNSESYKSIRKEFMTNKIPTQCVKACYDKEKLNVISPRQIINEYWKDYAYLQDSEIVNTPPIYLDFRFSNVCNFTCKMCGSDASTSWIKEAKEEFNIIGKKLEEWDNDLFWKDFNIIYPYIKKIYFAGGEPLILEQHYKVLNFLIDNNKTDIKLIYNTNLSILRYKDYNLLDLWAKFSNVSLYLSLDGVYSVGEYIRKGLNWDLLENNVKLVKPYISNISTTVQIYNIYNLPKLVLWSIDNDIPITGTTVINPIHYDIRILPNSEKIKIVNYYLSFIKSNNTLKKHHINMMLDWLRFMKGTVDNSNLLVKQFKIITQKQDLYRNENFSKIIPEFKEWYESI